MIGTMGSQKINLIFISSISDIYFMSFRAKSRFPKCREFFMPQEVYSAYPTPYGIKTKEAYHWAGWIDRAAARIRDS